jgi:outer membrane scaffolding protein for murein synthesis (MipA/OmpV family)
MPYRCVRPLSTAIVGAVGCFLAAAAQAQTPSPFAFWQNSAGIVLRPMGGPVPDWETVVGGGAVILPKYQGGKQYEPLPAFTLDVRYSDIAFLSTGDGLGVNLVRGETYRAGVAIAYDLGRTQHAERSIKGIGSIPLAPEAKLFAEAFFEPVVVSADVRRAIGGTNGLVGDLGAYVPVVGNETLVVFVGPGLSFGDAHYMQRVFGIGTNEAIPNSLYPRYDAKAGPAAVNFGLTVDYTFTKHWRANGTFGYERLICSAGSSPIAENPNQLGAAIEALYDF